MSRAPGTTPPPVRRATFVARAALLFAAGGLAALASTTPGCTVVQRFDPPADPEPLPAPPSPVLPGTDAGACAYDCLGGACQDGLCEPVELARDQGNANGLSFTGFVDGREVSLDGPDELASDATHVYFSKLDGEIRRVPRAGGPVEVVYEAPTRPPHGFVLSGDELFVTLGWGIERAPKAGGPATRVVGDREATSYVGALAASATEVFWVDGSEILACPRAGCTEPPRCVWASAAPGDVGKSITDLRVEPTAVGVDVFTTTLDGRLSFVGLGRSGVCQSPGTVSALYVARGPMLYGLSRHGDRTYAWGENVVLEAVPSGVPRYLSSGPSTRPLRAAAADAAHVYWIDAMGLPTKLLRVAVDGVAAPEVVLRLERGVRNLAHDGDALLLSTGDGRVLRMAKPPSGVLPPLR